MPPVPATSPCTLFLHPISPLHLFITIHVYIQFLLPHHPDAHPSTCPVCSSRSPHCIHPRLMPTVTGVQHHTASIHAQWLPASFPSFSFLCSSPRFIHPAPFSGPQVIHPLIHGLISPFISCLEASGVNPFSPKKEAWLEGRRVEKAGG